MFKKRFYKTKCKVTFELPQGIDGAKDVYIVGDFNNWDEHATKMEKLKDGRFKIVLDLALNRDYEYRYLVNGKEWHNDWKADRYVPNPFSGENSVISTQSTNGNA